jgi:hypothetical protein
MARKIARAAAHCLLACIRLRLPEACSGRLQIESALPWCSPLQLLFSNGGRIVYTKALAADSLEHLLVEKERSLDCRFTFPTIYAPIGMADVAAGEGALHTFKLLWVLTNKKSSISFPLLEPA